MTEGKAPPPQDVDLDADVLGGGRTAYKLTDVRGQAKRFVLPNDVPFPITVTFLRAGQKFEEVSVATATVEDVDAYESAWAMLLEAFLPIVQLQQPDVTLEDLSTGIGQSTLARWIAEVITRLTQAVQATNPKVNRATRRSQKPPARKKSAARSRPARSSSRSSAG